MSSTLLFILCSLSIVASDSYQELSIEITCVPQYGAGSGSWGTISGKCNCLDIVGISESACDENIDWTTKYSVVIYSITNTYYIQPWANDYYTTIDSQGLWSTGIHLGYEYEVRLVEFEDRYSVIDTVRKDASNWYQKLSIDITCVPPYGAGSSSWGNISGKCNCFDILDACNISNSESTCNENGINIDWSTKYSVVIWSITNKHWIQPWANDYYTAIDSEGFWSTGIHLGYEYEVYLVEFENISSVIGTVRKSASEYDPECIGVPYSTMDVSEHSTSAVSEYSTPDVSDWEAYNTKSACLNYSSLLSVYVTLLFSVYCDVIY